MRGQWCHHQHFLSLSLLLPIVLHGHLLVSTTSPFGFFFSELLLMPLNEVSLGDLVAGSLILDQLCLLTFHVAASAVLLPLMLHLFCLCALLLFLQLVVFFLESNKAELCDFLLNPLLALHLLPLIRREILLPIGSHLHRNGPLRVAVPTRSIALANRAQSSRPQSNRLQNHLSLVIHLLLQDKVAW